MITNIDKIQEDLMKKLEARPYNKKGKKDGNFNYIHQEYIVDAFDAIKKLLNV